MIGARATVVFLGLGLAACGPNVRERDAANRDAESAPSSPSPEEAARMDSASSARIGTVGGPGPAATAAPATTETDSSAAAEPTPPPSH